MLSKVRCQGVLLVSNYNIEHGSTVIAVGAGSGC